MMADAGYAAGSTPRRGRQLDYFRTKPGGTMSRPCQGLRRRSILLPLLFLAPIFAACSDSADRVLAPGDPSLSRTAGPALRVSTTGTDVGAVSYTHLRAHETPEHLVCR